MCQGESQMNYMNFLINKDYNPPYTESELFEEQFPELLNKSFETVLRLKDIQQKIVEMLPQLKRQLPSNEELQSTEGKLNLLTYILVRSLYGFANNIWITIDKQCDDLAVKISKNELNGHSDTVDLEKLVKDVEYFPLEEFLNDHVSGLLSFSNIFYCSQCIRDFDAIMGWTFRDIMGNISAYGITQQLLDIAIGDSIPTASSIGKLLDDDRTMRVY